jgi:transcription elongation factor GreA
LAKDVSHPRGKRSFFALGRAIFFQIYIQVTFFIALPKARQKKFDMSNKISYFTKESYEKFKSELEDLKSNGRKEAARAIAEAREKGDLSENAEYDAAREAQGLLELKISEMDKIMINARVIDAADLDMSKVVVLSRVKIKHTGNGKELVYQLVSETEADPRIGKISVTSPIGKGLLGKAVGEVATIQTPGGLATFEILDIGI